MSKVCTKCGVEKELEMFPTSNRTPDGRLSACKECKKEEYKARYHRRLEEDPKTLRRKIMLRDAKARAKDKGIPFNLVLEDIDAPDLCPILNKGIVWNHKGGSPMAYSPSLDKLIPELGYIKGNVRVISHKGNAWKSDMTKEDVASLLSYMTNNIDLVTNTT